MTHEPETPGRDHEIVFAEWITRVEAGEDLSIDDLLAGHPEVAEALEQLYEDWRLFAQLLGRAVPGSLDDDAGIVLPPLSGTAEDDGASAALSPELLGRLGIHAPNSGRYRFRSVIGRGGGGVVLKVWDTKLNRPLAMKVVLGRGEERPSGDTPQVDGRTLTRFVDEARIASQLSHPGIVPVHELGADEAGRAYFTMKLVKGEDLSVVFEHVKTGHDGWNPTRALTVLLRVCESLAFAHEKGVIHRDLKPANVMVGRHGEVYVMDWGLARVLGEEDHRDLRLRRAPAAASVVDSLRHAERGATPESPLLTMDGSVVGTPAYMPPEQARGELEQLGPRSDVYAVGAMLYELLAGEPPFVPNGARIAPGIVLMRVVEGPPRPLAELAPRAPAELIAICDRAMQRDPAKRYADVSAFADDLRAFVENRVVNAYESGTWPETKKWVKRNRGLAVSLVSVVLALVAGVVVSWALKKQADRNAELAFKNGLEAERMGKEAKENAYYAAVVGAQDARSSGQPAAVRRLLDTAPERLRNWEWNFLDADSDSSLVKLTGHTDRVKSATFNSTGSHVLTVSDDGTAGVWKADVGTLVAHLGESKRTDTSAIYSHADVTHAAFTPDGTMVLTESRDSAVRVWRAVNGEELNQLGDSGSNQTPWVFSPDGSRVITTARDGMTRVWDIASGEVLAMLEGSTNTVQSASFSPDGTRILTISNETTAWIWDAETGKPLIQLRGHTAALRSASFDIDGRRILTTSDDHTARVWSASSGTQLVHLECSEGVRSAFISPGGQRILTTLDDSAMQVWDAVSGAMVARVAGVADGLQSASFSADGTRILSTFEDGTALVSDAETGRVLTRLGRSASGIRHSSFSPDGSRVLVLPWNGTPSVWPVDGNNEALRLEGHTSFISSGSFSPDGSRVITASADGTARIWSALTGRVEAIELPIGRLADASLSPDGWHIAMAPADGDPVVLKRADRSELFRLEGHTGKVTSVSFGPDGSNILTTSADGTARVWDAASGCELARIKHRYTVRAGAFSQDGKRVVTTTADDAVHVWDSVSGHRVSRFGNHHAPVYSGAISLDGSFIITASYPSTEVWDLASHKMIARLHEHSSGAYYVRISPDGEHIATASDDGTARIWSIRDGAELARLEGHKSDVVAVSFSPDGSRVVTASSEHTARVWDPLSGRQLALLEGHLDAVTTASFSADGSCILTASIDGTARVWDAVAYRARYAKVRAMEAATPEGERALERSLAAKRDFTAAAKALRINAELEPLVRQAALDALARRAQEVRNWVAMLQRTKPLVADLTAAIETDTTRTSIARTFALEFVETRGDIPNVLLEVALPILGSSNNGSELQIANRCLQRAVELAPDNSKVVTTQGIERYRAGDFESALASLLRSDGLRRAEFEPDDATNVAFLAMTYWQLDREAESHAQLSKLEALLQQGGAEEEVAYLAEAKALIDP